MLHSDTVYGTFIQHSLNPAIVDVFPETCRLCDCDGRAQRAGSGRVSADSLFTGGQGNCLPRTTHRREVDDVSKVCDTYDGVVVPYVEDVEHCRRLAAAAVYRPLKGVALDRVLAEGKWPSEKTKNYVTNERYATRSSFP